MRAGSIARQDGGPGTGLTDAPRTPYGRGVRACLAALSLLAACSDPSRASTPEPLEHVERQGSGELPLIVALHGRGDRPERFSSVFDDLAPEARVLLVRAPIDEGRGRAWFSFRYGFDAAMDDLEALLPRLRRTIARYLADHPTRGDPLLVGFSQGAMIAYAYAARHPDELRAVFPISGGLPERFEPRRGDALPPVRAIHGTADEVIEPRWNRQSVSRLRRRGADATLTEVPGAPHWMTADMRAALFEAMDPYLVSSAEAGPGR